MKKTIKKRKKISRRMTDILTPKSVMVSSVDMMAKTLREIQIPIQKTSAKNKVTFVTLLLDGMAIISYLNNVRTQSLSFDEIS